MATGKGSAHVDGLGEGGRAVSPHRGEREMAARRVETHVSAARLPGRRAVVVYLVACLGSPEVQVTLTFPYPAGRFGAPMGAGRVHG